MLENKSTRQDRQRRAIDCFRIERDDRNAEEIPDDAEETLFVDFPGIEHLRRPRTAVHVLGELGRFLARLDTAREQKIYNGLAGVRIHGGYFKLSFAKCSNQHSE